MTFSRPLRLAGESLRERREKLFDELIPYLLIVFAFWIVCIVEWAQKIVGQHPDPWFWMFLSFLVAAYGGIRIFRLHPHFRNLRVGEAGERCVAEVLDRIRAKGFVAVHDLQGQGFNIDHVVVGPSGVYAIETKARSGHGTIDYRDENQLIFGGRICDGRPLRQARGSAYAVHAQLKEQLRGNYWVKPLLVFVGDWRVRRGAGDFLVDVVTADRLGNYFDRQQPELTRTEIAHISSHLERSART